MTLEQAENDPWADVSLPENDVRQAVAALIGGGAEPRIADVAWEEFAHAYGSAGDVPALLRGLSDPDPDRAAATLDTLWNNVRHQGGSSTAAALVVPFLIRIAADRSVHHRGLMLNLAAEAGRRNHFGRDSRTGLLRATYPDEDQMYDNSGYLVGWTLQAARCALAADAALLVALLDDPDPAVRCGAAYALAAASSPAPALPQALRARLDGESDPAVRISLILAATQLGCEHNGVPDAVDWTAGLWSAAGNPMDVRFGAALGWLCASNAPAPPELFDLLCRAVTPAMADVMALVPWPDDIDYYGGLATWLVTFLGEPPGPRAHLVTTLVAASDPAVAVSACRAAYELAATWRPQAPDMIGLLAECLDHAEPSVSLAAARHLAEAGTAPSLVADQLAAALDHENAEVGAWATVALAHCDDPRAVAPLRELLTRDECPWPSAHRWGDHVPPSVRLLDHLRPHADALMPAICHRLALPAEGGWARVRHDLIRGLGTWGEHAAAAHETLTTLLAAHEQPDVPGVARALARIGPVAAGAAGVLDHLAGAHPEHLGVLTWARWKLTGERTGDTAAVLAQRAATRPYGPESLRLLADLGPAAADHEVTMRNLLADGWYQERIEAAHALWRVTGDSANTAPVLLRVVDGPGYGQATQSRCVEYLAQFGAAAAPAVGYLTAFLSRERRAREALLPHDAISWDEHCHQVAAATLDRVLRAVGDA